MNSIKFACVVMAGALLLSGCSPRGAVPVQDSPPTAIEESPAAEEPAPEPTPEGTHFSGTTEVTDFEGYALEIAYDIRYGPTASSNVANEKPGFTALSTPATTSLSMRNVSGRTYDFTDADLQILLGLAFPVDSPACTLTGISTPEVCIVPVKTTNDFSRGLTPTHTTLSDGQTAQFTVFNPAYGLVAERTITDISLPSVDESLADAIGAALFTPAYFMVIGNGTLVGSCELPLGMGMHAYLLASEPAYPGTCKQ